MMKRSLNFKLITGGVLSVLLPLLVVGVFSITKASGSLESLGKEQAINLAKDLANMTQMVLQEEVKLVKELSLTDLTIGALSAFVENGPDTAEDKVSALSAMLVRSMAHRGDDYESILVTDVSGTVFADGNNGKFKGISLKDRRYFEMAKQGQANVSTPVKSKLTGKPIAPVCAPIYSTEGKFLGTVTNVLKMDFLSEKITTVKVGQTGYAFLVDQTGLTIAHPNGKHVLNTNLAKQKGMENIMGKMLAQQTGVGSYVFEGIDKIAGYAPVELTNWSIGITQPSKEFLGAAHAIRNFILAIGGIFLALTILAVFFFARSISKPIMLAADGLNDGSDQVASASGQVSAAGQSLAEGASEQAASIEETSSSLEEMSSMTKQNAGNAKQADSLMQEANQVVTKANDSMAELTHSMEEISKASEETSKIIKTIDEIAFQTNLLALNAAVEAARAGEAGAGFAVVADEVRNLAMRAADAAKNTSDLIESTVKKVKDGGELVAITNEAFTQVAESASKVGELVSEIAAASNEQAQGIEQVNTAVAEMDKVVQQNAANAEESASASEEMNAQAEEMKRIVSGLVALVGGRTSDRKKVTHAKAAVQVDAACRSLSTPMKGTKTREVYVYQDKEVNPRQVIPLDDADFRDF